MTRIWNVARSLIVLACAGCAFELPVLPERLMETREVFPSMASTVPPPEFPGASRTLSFRASFEDVFDAASKSASQAQFVVDDEQKSRGLILASRPFRANPYTGEPLPRGYDHRFFYAIAVRELAPKSTEVRIAAKVQGKCAMNDSGFTAVSSTAAQQNATCGLVRKGVWSGANQGGANYSPDEDFARFMTFLRNNLIAAGVL